MYDQMGDSAVITPVRIVSYSCHSSRQIEIERDEWNGSGITLELSCIEGVCSKIIFCKKEPYQKDTTAQSIHLARFSLNVEVIFSWSVDIHRTYRERGSVISKTILHAQATSGKFVATSLSQAYHDLQPARERADKSSSIEAKWEMIWPSQGIVPFCEVESRLKYGLTVEDPKWPSLVSAIWTTWTTFNSSEGSECHWWSIICRSKHDADWWWQTSQPPPA